MLGQTLAATFPLEPPRHLSAPDSAETIALVVAATAFVVTLGLAARSWAKHGDAVGFFIVIGGALASFQEPIVDLLGNIWLRTDDPLFTTFGRPFPTWSFFAYGAFYGLFTYVIYEQARNGITRARLFGIVAPVMTINLVMEPLLVWWDLYVYFGDPPFDVFGLPVYWCFINCTGMVVAATILSRNRELFAGRRAVGALLVVPLTIAAASVATGLPVFSAINSDAPEAVAWIAAVATAAIALCIIALSARILCTDEPGTAGGSGLQGAQDRERREAAGAAADPPARVGAGAA